MQRLTGPEWSNRHYHIYANVYPKRKEMEPNFQKIVDRLGAYEDTGLSPDEITKLFESYKKSNMEQAEENYKLEQEIPHWIPVSERLPEEAYGCLLIVEEDDFFGEPQEVLLPYFAGYDGEQWNDGEGQQVPFEVTHWMPLPAVPKEEK